MKWTDIKPPTNNVSYYDHTICKSPIGDFIIEWKSWKEYPSYSIILDGYYIDSTYSLEEAKKIAYNHILELKEKLDKFFIDE